MKKMDEQELARYCSQGDRIAQDELYRRYAARLETLCRRYLGDRDEAKDLMLDTLIQALEKMDTYKYSGEGSLYAWLSRIAVNKAINRIKRYRWRMIPLDPLIKDDIPEPTEEEMAMVPPEKLREWIAALPDLRRTVFNLYCIDGHSHKEIAGMLRISERGSTSVLSKAKKQLKEQIKHYLKTQE